MTVIHVNDAEADDIDISRRAGLLGHGGWGNPFVIGRDGTREEVIAKYQRALWIEIKAAPEHMITQLAQLANHNLACYCAPKPCHGDVLERAAYWANNVYWEALEVSMDEEKERGRDQEAGIYDPSDPKWDEFRSGYYEVFAEAIDPETVAAQLEVGDIYA